MMCLIDGDPLAYIAGWGNTEEEAKVKIDALVEEIVNSAFTDDFKIAVKGKDNFRDKVISGYKGHRKSSSEQAKMVKVLREHMVEAHNAVEAHGQEADDLLAQWAEECREEGEDFVIASIDKDLLTIPGNHYNIRKGTIVYVDEDHADYLLNQQLLMGDRADGIPGLPGIGAKKSENILADVKFGKRRAAVIAAYKEQYGGTWQKELQITGDLIYIRKYKDERFKI